MVQPRRQIRLKKGCDRRFRSGHPWIFSNELAVSPKNHLAGEVVDLLSSQGEFLGAGYINPHSLISFRELTRRNDRNDLMSSQFFCEMIEKAQHLRHTFGYQNFSYRLCFGESDQLPGLIIDRYLFTGKHRQAFVIQTHTAGMLHALPSIQSGLEVLVRRNREQNATMPSWEETAIIVRNDIKVLSLEGLQPQPPQIIKKFDHGSEEMLKEPITFVLRSASPKNDSDSEDKGLDVTVSLWDGQKTGFFFDQFGNISRLCQLLSEGDFRGRTEAIKILDLFSYVGQWSLQLADLARKLNIPIEITCVDASQGALDFAEKNLRNFEDIKIRFLKMDILEALPNLNEVFDIVICDPPALIKSKKDHPQGCHGYLKLNSIAIGKVKPGGVFVSCSCSSLLLEQEFRQILQKSSVRAKRNVSWVSTGGLSPDHPIRLGFTEGMYLKSWIGISNY